MVGKLLDPGDGVLTANHRRSGARRNYVYKLIIDGVTVPDPNNTYSRFADQPPYSQLIVPGNGPAYYDARNVPHGAVTRHVYHSDVTNGEREMYVYTPPGYDRSKKYPVLYLVGGSGELASTWPLDGRANFIMDNLLAEGKALPMIIAMPINQMIHRSHPKHTELTFNLFEAELRKHIIPFVEKAYSVRADRNGRALSGLSMGGRHTQFVGFKCLDLFASFGVLSAGDIDTEKSSAAFLNDPGVTSLHSGENIPIKASDAVKANNPVSASFPYPCSYEGVHGIDSGTLPYVLVIRDSYVDAMMKFFDRNFRK